MEFVLVFQKNKKNKKIEENNIFIQKYEKRFIKKAKYSA